MKYSCYYIIHLGCLMGFTMHFYIIFWTNLLTQGPVKIAVFFAYFSVSQKRNIKRNPNRRKPLWGSFLDRKQTRRLGDEVGEATRRPRGRRARPHPRGPLVAPLTDFLRLYILIYPEKNPGAPRNPISTAATFCTCEIPSWGLFRSSAGGGIDHGGLLHHHHSPPMKCE